MEVCVDKERIFIPTNYDKDCKKNEDRPTDSNALSINCLNDECLVKIFEYCDVFQIQKVCTRWRDVANRSWRIFTLYNTSVWGIDEYGTVYIDIATIQEHFSRYGRHLKGLIINEPEKTCTNPESRIQIPQLNEKALSVILPHCPNLRYVKTFLKNNSTYAIQFLTNHCENLTDLTLNCQGFGQFYDEERFQDALSRLFESKKKLKRLHFEGPLGGKSLTYLPSDMEGIFIRNQVRDPDSFLKEIFKFHKLQKLELGGIINETHLMKALGLPPKRNGTPAVCRIDVLNQSNNSLLRNDFQQRMLKYSSHDWSMNGRPTSF